MQKRAPTTKTDKLEEEVAISAHSFVEAESEHQIPKTPVSEPSSIVSNIAAVYPKGSVYGVIESFDELMHSREKARSDAQLVQGLRRSNRLSESVPITAAALESLNKKRGAKGHRKTGGRKLTEDDAGEESEGEEDNEKHEEQKAEWNASGAHCDDLWVRELTLTVDLRKKLNPLNLD